MSISQSTLEDLQLRPLHQHDLDALHALASRQAIDREGAGAPYPTLEKRRAWLEGLLTNQYAIGAWVGPALVGWAQLTPNKARLSHVAVLGIGVHEAWHRRGIGNALMAALIDQAHHWLGIRRLELRCYAENAAAIALYRKFGFVLEAVERCSSLRDGVLVDSYRMAKYFEALPFAGQAPREVEPLALADTAMPGPAVPVRHLVGSAAACAPAGVIVRPVELTDAAGISALHAPHSRVQRNTLALPFRSEYWVSDWLKAQANGNGVNVCAVSDDGTVVGHAALMRAAGRRAHGATLAICVDDAHAGRGIGAFLMASLLECADLALGLRRIELTVFTDNANAIALYRRFGFVEEGILRAYASRDGVLADAFQMARLVEAPGFAAPSGI